VNFGLTSGSKVCSNTNLPGDKLVATLNETVTGTNGAIIPGGFDRGTRGHIVTGGEKRRIRSGWFSGAVSRRERQDVSRRSQRHTDGAVRENERSRTATRMPTRKRSSAARSPARFLGQMIGHNTKGTVIGAAAGAAAGAAVAKSGEKWQACLPAGAPLKLTLNAPLVISS
jgi:hypothetical protein